MSNTHHYQSHSYSLIDILTLNHRVRKLKLNKIKLRPNRKALQSKHSKKQSTTKLNLYKICLSSCRSWGSKRLISLFKKPSSTSLNCFMMIMINGAKSGLRHTDNKFIKNHDNSYKKFLFLTNIPSSIF